MGWFCPWPQLPLVTSGLLPHTQQRLTTRLFCLLHQLRRHRNPRGMATSSPSSQSPPNSTTSNGPSDHAGLIPETVAPPPLSWGGVFPVGPEATALLFSSDDPGAAFLPSFGSWDQHSLFPKAFLLLTHCSPQLALYTTSELTSSLPACFPAGFTRVGQQSHGLS